MVVLLPPGCASPESCCSTVPGGIRRWSRLLIFADKLSAAWSQCKPLLGVPRVITAACVLGLSIPVVLVARVVFLLKLSHANISIPHSQQFPSAMDLCSITDPVLC